MPHLVTMPVTNSSARLPGACTRRLRAADAPARLGGDEFAVMVAGREVPVHAGVGLCSVNQREMEVAR